jgi:UDP-N-acetylmuramoyl-tripeptide--D-alanyl-D-alanine ligase
MTRLRLSEAAVLLEGTLQGDDASFSALSTDTRQLREGELFIALRGPNFNGHDFIAQARRKGACAALVQHRVDDALAQLQVVDTLRALGQLGSVWRQRFAGRLVALTGSNGKTTVKEMITAILRTQGRVLATRGNLNNEIGLPLTLMRLDDEDYAVVEMGANHPGEIAYLADLARPDVALITNIGPAHLEGFGDLDGVARAKGEIFRGLSADGIAVINRDEPYAQDWIQSLQRQTIVDFGLNCETAAVRADIIDVATSRFRLKAAHEQIEIRLPLPGRHNVANALAAAAAATALGISPEQIREGLQNMTGVAGRLQLQAGPYASQLINDTYNANPASLTAGIQVLSTRAKHGWLVLGDMAELGENTLDLHRQAGEQAKAAGIERVYCCGKYSIETARSFGDKGYFFDTLEALTEALQRALQASVARPPTLLIKGSRSMQMERVVRALLAMSP